MGPTSKGREVRERQGEGDDGRGGKVGKGREGREEEGRKGEGGSGMQGPQASRCPTYTGKRRAWLHLLTAVPLTEMTYFKDVDD